MMKLIGVSLGMLIIMSGASATNPSGLETLEKEHKDPTSMVSQLPMDVITHTAKYLNVCPVLTAQNEVLGVMIMGGKQNMSDQIKDEFLRSRFGRTNWGGYIFKSGGIDYIFIDILSGVYIREVNPLKPDESPKPKTLKQVLVEDNPSFILRGTLVDDHENPSNTGEVCLYEGVQPGKYFFRFTLASRGDDPVYNRWWDRTAKNAKRLAH